jgi:hypothetical protein
VRAHVSGASPWPWSPVADRCRTAASSLVRFLPSLVSFSLFLCRLVFVAWRSAGDASAPLVQRLAPSAQASSAPSALAWVQQARQALVLRGLQSDTEPSLASCARPGSWQLVSSSPLCVCSLPPCVRCCVSRILGRALLLHRFASESIFFFCVRSLVFLCALSFPLLYFVGVKNTA